VQLFETVKSLGFVEEFTRSTQRRRYNSLPLVPEIKEDVLSIADNLSIPVMYVPHIEGDHYVIGQFNWQDRQEILIKKRLKASYQNMVLLHEFCHAMRPTPYDWQDNSRRGIQAQVCIEEMIAEGAAAIIIDDLYKGLTPQAMKASATYIAYFYSRLRAYYDPYSTYLDDQYAHDVYSLVWKFSLLKNGVAH